MNVNKKRLFLVLSLAAVGFTAAGAAYTFRFKKKQQAQAIEASANRFLQAKQYDSARIEADKLLALQPRSAQAMLLKGKALLGDRDPSRIQTTDRRGLDAMRSFIQATRAKPDLVEAQQTVVKFFTGSGDLNEAASAAREILKSAPTDPDANFALAAAALEKRQIQEASTHVDQLMTHEKPLRPRTVWAAVQAAALTGKESDLKDRIAKALPEVEAKRAQFSNPQDRIAFADLTLWKARQETDPAAIQQRLDQALSQLAQIVSEPEFSGAPPRMLVNAATRFLPSPEAVKSPMTAAQSKLAPKVNELIQTVYKKAIDAQVLDPTVYVDFATRLRNNNQIDEAIATVEKGIAVAKKTSPEARRLFTLCDLWLAKHFLTAKQPEKAQPHIDALLVEESTQAWGQMLAGYRLVEKSEWDAGARMLGQAIKQLPDHGIVNVLYGLCQLKRGYVGEGRQHLEKGIRLGADDPRYKAWLAIALSEAGYHDQAMTVARQVLSEKQTESLGQVLIGQLRLRSGQYRAAEDDLRSAIRTADAANKPALQLMLAEVLMANEQGDQAQQLLRALQEVPSVAARAYALEYRFLKAKKRHEEAEKVLTQARMKLPDDVTIVTIDVARLVDAKEFRQAVLLLTEMQRRNPKSPTPALLLADVHDAAGDPQASIDVLKQAAEKLPEETSLKVRMAERLLIAREFEEANRVLADLKGNPSVNPATVDALLAQSAWLRGDAAKAKQIIDQRFSQDADNPTINFIRGQILGMTGEYEAAANLFELTLGTGNYQSRTVQALLETYLRLGQTDKAIDLLHKAEKRGQSVQPLRERLLRLLARREQFDQAEREIEQLIKTEPTEENLALAVSLLRYMQKPERARELLDRSLEKMPDSSALLEHKIAICLEQKRYEQAEALLTKAIDSKPSHPTFHVLRVFMLLESKRNKEADAAAKAGWKACPGNPAIAALCMQTAVVLDRPDEAIEFAQRAAKDYPKLPAPKYMLARVYESLGRRDRAIDLLASMLAETPGDAAAAHHYLRLCIAEGQTSDLKGTVDRLLAANPDNPMLLGVLVEYFAGKEDIKSAEATLARMERLTLPSSLKHYSQAVVAVARKDYPTAEKSLKVAAADPRGHLPSQFLLARLYASQQKVNQALEEVSRILRQQPTSVPARLMRVDFLDRAGKLGEAEQACRAYLVEDPSSEAMRLALCQLLVKRGQPKDMAEAVDLAEQLLIRGLTNPADFELCAKLLLQAGRSERVRTAVASLARDKTELRLAAGRAFLLAGDAKTAREVAERLLETEPANPTAKLLLADATAHLARETKSPTGLEQSVVQYREVLKMIPGHVVAANNLAWILGVQLEKPHRALEELLLAVPAAKSPSADLPVDLIDTVGVLHLKMGHENEAQLFLEAALARNPDSASTHFHLGELYRKQKRTDRAKHCYAQVLKLAPKSEWAARVEQSRLAD